MEVPPSLSSLASVQTSSVARRRTTEMSHAAQTDVARVPKDSAALCSSEWFGDGLCRYCSQPVNRSDAVVTCSYWQGMKFVSHKACKVAGEKVEALECQTIDADCNDCRHFKRGHLVPHAPHVQKTIDDGDVPGFGTETWTGNCLKFDRPTTAFPKKWTGRECFDHRRSESPNDKLRHRRNNYEQ